MLMPNVDASAFWRLSRWPKDVWFSIFCDFYKPLIVHPVYMVSSCSFADFGPSYDILTLADRLRMLRCEFYQCCQWCTLKSSKYKVSSSSSSSSYRTMSCISLSLPVLLRYWCPTFASPFWRLSRWPKDVWFSIFCDFCKPLIVHPVCTVSSCSSADFGPSYDILTLADRSRMLRCEFYQCCQWCIFLFIFVNN